MATWAIGDLQGCFATFEHLLRAIAFDVRVDRLWLVGDLVNRGAGSLEVLRWCRDHDAVVTAVLGNHDLHLLAAASGLRKLKGRDTLQPVLDAPDAEELLAWVRARPLLVRQGDHVLVHAGLPPWWSLEEAEGHARRLEGRIAAGERAILMPLPKRRPAAWDPAASWADQVALSAFVAMRCLDSDDRLVRGFKGPPEERAGSWRPWYDLWNGPETVVFGHWARLGHRRGAHWLALDSGCVWGGPMTAVCLDDDRVVQVPNREATTARVTP